MLQFTGWLDWAIKIPAVANCTRMCVPTVKTCNSVSDVIDAGHRRAEQSQGAAAAAASGMDECVTVCVRLRADPPNIDTFSSSSSSSSFPFPFYMQSTILCVCAYGVGRPFAAAPTSSFCRPEFVVVVVVVVVVIAAVVSGEISREKDGPTSFSLSLFQLQLQSI